MKDLRLIAFVLPRLHAPIAQRHFLRHRSFLLLHVQQIFSLTIFRSSALMFNQPTCLGVDMTTSVTLASSTSASKRARSQDSQRLSNSFSASGISGRTEAPYSPHIPAFLHQSRSGPLLHEQVCARWHRIR